MKHTNNPLHNKLFLVLWFPHSGGRWLNRGLLDKNSSIQMTEFFNPLLLLTTDQLLRMDTTEQVHKHRSKKKLQADFEIVRKSVEKGRHEGIKYYFKHKIRSDKASMENGQILGGALPCGAHIAHFDTFYLSKILPQAHFIHLVRSPLDCFVSFTKRLELDADPYLMASYWSRFNIHLRRTLPEERTMCLRYEDLLSDTKKQLKSICKFINCEFDLNMLAGIKEYYGIHDQNPLTVPDEVNKSILEITRNERVHYGY